MFWGLVMLYFSFFVLKSEVAGLAFINLLHRLFLTLWLIYSLLLFFLSVWSALRIDLILNLCLLLSRLFLSLFWYSIHACDCWKLLAVIIRRLLLAEKLSVHDLIFDKSLLSFLASCKENSVPLSQKLNFCH